MIKKHLLKPRKQIYRTVYIMYKNINVTKVMEYNLVITISFHHLSRLSYELDLEEDLTVAWTGLYPLFKSNN